MDRQSGSPISFPALRRHRRRRRRSTRASSRKLHRRGWHTVFVGADHAPIHACVYNRHARGDCDIFFPTSLLTTCDNVKIPVAIKNERLLQRPVHAIRAADITRGQLWRGSKRIFMSDRLAALRERFEVFRNKCLLVIFSSIFVGNKNI